MGGITFLPFVRESKPVDKSASKPVKGEANTSKANKEKPKNNKEEKSTAANKASSAPTPKAPKQQEAAEVGKPPATEASHEKKAEQLPKPPKKVDLSKVCVTTCKFTHYLFFIHSPLFFFYHSLLPYPSCHPSIPALPLSEVAERDISLPRSTLPKCLA